jgi:hypothetical protein
MQVDAPQKRFADEVLVVLECDDGEAGLAVGRLAHGVGRRRQTGRSGDPRAGVGA